MDLAWKCSLAKPMQTIFCNTIATFAIMRIILVSMYDLSFMRLDTLWNLFEGHHGQTQRQPDHGPG